MALSIETVKQIVSIWNQLFPGVRGEAQLELLEKTFYRSMQRTFSDDTFKIAAEMVLRETKYFPTIKDMFDLRNAVYQVKNNMIKKADGVKRIADGTDNLSPEEIKQNLEKIEIIFNMLAGKLSATEAEVMQNNLTTWVRGGQG